MKKQIMHFILLAFFIIFAKFVVRKVTKYISKYKRLYGGVNNRIANDYQLQSTDELFIKDAKYFLSRAYKYAGMEDDGPKGGTA